MTYLVPLLISVVKKDDMFISDVVDLNSNEM